MKRIPYGRIVKKSMSAGNSKVKCDGCGKIKRIKYMRLYKNRVLCSGCIPHKIGFSKDRIKEGLAKGRYLKLIDKLRKEKNQTMLKLKKIREIIRK